MRAQAEQLLLQLREQVQRLSRQYLGPAEAVGLDIGADRAKAARVVDLGDRLEVALFGWTPLRAGGPPGGEPVPSAEVARRVRDLIEGWGFPTRRLVAGLGGQDLLVRKIKLPFADLKKAARVAPFELEHELPLPREDLVLELFPLSSNGSASPSDASGLPALALATTRERLGERLALLAAAGLAPRAVETDLLALYQAFGALWPAEQEAAVLDCGARKTTLLVVRGGRLEAVRTIPWGGDALSAALAAHWGVPFAQADRIKQERCSIVGPDEAAQASRRRLETSGLICAALEPLLREIRRTLLACAQEAEGPGGSRCGRLYICGGGSLLAGLKPYLARELECEVRPLAASEQLGLAAGGPEAEALLPTALGLALRRLRKASPVDFRRPELTPRREAEGPRGSAIYVGAAIVLTAAIGLADLQVRVSCREARLEQVKARAEEIYREAFPGKGAVPDPLRQMKRKLEEAEAEPLPDVGGAHPVLEVLRSVAASTDGVKIKVRRLAVEGLSVRLEGETESKEVVTRFRMALLKTGLFRDCVIKDAASQKAGTVGFSLDLKRT